MNILADESVDQQIVEQLRRAGHQVIYIAETEPGISDTEVLGLASRKSSLLLTADRDFGELVFRQKLISVAAPAPAYLLRFSHPHQSSLPHVSFSPAFCIPARDSRKSIVDRTANRIISRLSAFGSPAATRLPPSPFPLPLALATISLSWNL